MSSGHELELTRPADEVSTHLKLHCRSGTNFDVAVLDIWDGKTQRSTFKVQFDRVTIASYQWNPFFHKDTIVLSFETMKLSKAAGAQMITIDPAPSQWAVSQAAK